MTARPTPLGLNSESVVCRFSKCRSKNWKNIQEGAQRRKIYPRSLRSVFSVCCTAGMDPALVEAHFLSQVHPPSRKQDASGGCLHGGASFKVEKPHFAARKRRVWRIATMK